jgi:hypothetical protein
LLTLFGSLSGEKGIREWLSVYPHRRLSGTTSLVFVFVFAFDCFHGSGTRCNSVELPVDLSITVSRLVCGRSAKKTKNLISAYAIVGHVVLSCPDSSLLLVTCSHHPLYTDGATFFLPQLSSLSPTLRYSFPYRISSRVLIFICPSSLYD